MILSSKEPNKIISAICGIIAIIGSIAYMNSKSTDFLGANINLSGTGLYVFIGASALLLVGSFMCKSSNQ